MHLHLLYYIKVKNKAEKPLITYYYMLTNNKNK